MYKNRNKNLFKQNQFRPQVFINRKVSTGNNGRALATRTGGCDFESQPSHTKDLKNGNRYTQLSAKLESDIDKPRKWLSSGRMLCERLPCPNGGIKHTRTSYAEPSLITVHYEN